MPPKAKAIVLKTEFQYREDALEALAENSPDVEAIIDRTLDWIVASNVRLFHGTRLTDEEVKGLHLDGLRILNIVERIDWLMQHVPEIGRAIKRGEAIDLVRSGRMGGREGQIHASISRMAMAEFEYLFEGQNSIDGSWSFPIGTTFSPFLRREGSHV